jgi:hypothetical protein
MAQRLELKEHCVYKHQMSCYINHQPSTITKDIKAKHFFINSPLYKSPHLKFISPLIKMPGSGSCLCGAIAYEYTGKSYSNPTLKENQNSEPTHYPTGEPATAAICHCIDCQKWAGSGNSTNLVVPRDAFHIIKGVVKKFDMKGNSGNDYPHFFCGGETFLLF